MGLSLFNFGVPSVDDIINFVLEEGRHGKRLYRQNGSQVVMTNINKEGGGGAEILMRQCVNIPFKVNLKNHNFYM